MKITAQIVSVSLALWIPAAAMAGSAPRLFDVAPGETPFGPGAEAARRVEVRADLVLGGRPRLHLEMPDGLEFEARRLQLERRGIDSVTWRGKLAESPDSDVILSVTRGVLSGWIHSRFGDYEIRPLPDGDSVVSRIARDDLPGCGPSPIPAFEPLGSGAPLAASDRGRRAGANRSPGLLHSSGPRPRRRPPRDQLDASSSWSTRRTRSSPTVG